MRVFKDKKINEKEIDKIFCDICKKEIEKDKFGYFFDHIHIEKTWGYNSDKDGEYTELDVCESCFDKLKHN